MQSFSVKTYPPLFLLLLSCHRRCVLGASNSRTVGAKVFQISLRLEVEKYENSEEDLPVTTIQALNMWIYELVYARSNESKAMLQATHSRVTLSYAAQQLQREEELYPARREGIDEAAWISWIKVKLVSER
jgi:hypothetical protein